MTTNISVACWNYDRTSAIADGRVKPDGLQVRYVRSTILESVDGMLSGRYDAGEFSLSAYAITFFREKLPFIAIPVFVSRVFRHRSIFIRNNSDIKNPKDLVGKRVGIPRYRQTAGVWMRGILADEYQLPVNAVSYFQGDVDEAEKPEWQRFGVPKSEVTPSRADIKLEFVEGKRTLYEMLISGELDAIYSAMDPKSLSRRNEIKRLFEDYVLEEKRYFAKTKIFPIMHVIVIKKSVYDENPKIARSLYDAFLESKRIAGIDLNETGYYSTMLPWQVNHVKETRETLGDDFWPYGVKANMNTLKTFLRYSYEQGLAKRILSPEEIFAPETVDT